MKTTNDLFDILKLNLVLTPCPAISSFELVHERMDYRVPEQVRVEQRQQSERLII